MNSICFDDLPPDDKDFVQLEIDVLRGASGVHVHIKDFNDEEINICARQLIKNGYLRGTIYDQTRCSWSRLTSRGMYRLYLLENGNTQNL